METTLEAENAYEKALQRIDECRRQKDASLYLGFLGLTTLPPAVAQLVDLKHLDLSCNQFTTLPSEFPQLSQLTRLNLSGNQFASLPPEVTQFSSLTYLSLCGNRISALTQEIAELSSLRHLIAFDNQLSTLPSEIGRLEQLERLILEDNSLLELPESLRRLTHLKELTLHGNDALGLPLELLGPPYSLSNDQTNPPADPKKILDYYFRTRKGKRPLNEAKLILIGRGGVGKTCLIKRLIHDTFDKLEQETSGIEILPWPVTLPEGDAVRLHVWDFGGQEILHATHQFFLTERTVYLLVLSGREGNPTQDAEYWLQLIRSFGGDSRVIIALNKSKQHPFDVNRGLLLEKYPQIACFVSTDCEDARGIPDLRAAILTETSNIEHRKVDFPADWFQIKERLASMKENFLTWDQYQETCRTLGENDIQAQRDLAGYLHILGIALNYRDDPRLKDTHVLNPRWVTEGIYTLLRSGHKERAQRQGVLQKADLITALPVADYPANCHQFLLDLMEKFQLSFPLLGGNSRYLVPELLGENQPEDVLPLLAESGLGFRYQYEVLPEGLLPRFIVQTHHLSEANAHLRWRTGVILNDETCRAVVRADARERRVDIHITGPERQRRDLLAIIRDRFEEQHRELKGLTVDQRVPIPGEKPDVTVSYRFLQELEEEGVLTVRSEGMTRSHSVSDLLNGIESPSRRHDPDAHVPTPMPNKKHLFLSYCRDNQPAVRQLRDDLIAAGESVWWDQDILPGQDWKLAIDAAMKAAYAVVVCLSQETQARTTTGIYPELANAIEAYRHYAPGDIFLIPVRLSDCELPPFEINATLRLDRLQSVDLFPPAARPANLQRLIQALQAAPLHP